MSASLAARAPVAQWWRAPRRGAGRRFSFDQSSAAQAGSWPVACCRLRVHAADADEIAIARTLTQARAATARGSWLVARGWRLPLVRVSERSGDGADCCCWSLEELRAEEWKETERAFGNQPEPQDSLLQEAAAGSSPHFSSCIGLPNSWLKTRR